MIDIAKIYEATDNGRKIIVDLYPDSEKCFSDKTWKFKLRAEKTPSTGVFRHEKTSIWNVHDFGSGKNYNPVQLYMEHEGCDFPTACDRLGALYGVEDSSAHSGPVIETRPATKSQKDDTREWEWNKEFTPAELALMGPLVRQEHLDELSWHSCKYIAYIKNGQATYIHSSDTFPIFMRECFVSATEQTPEGKFYKIYKPRAKEKRNRFEYYAPYQKMPQDYIHGFTEMLLKYEELQPEEPEPKEGEEEETRRAKHPAVKLEEVIICSGERDAACVKSLGYVPLWFNSETAEFTPAQYKRIMQYTKRIVNIPDIDETGIRQGKVKAMDFIDLYTVWLPAGLRAHKDNRGNPMKDFRDWMGMPSSDGSRRNQHKEFQQMLTIAKRTRWWDEDWSNKKHCKVYNLNSYYLNYFLQINGFWCMKDEFSKTEDFIRISGHVVKHITGKDIRAFLREWAESGAYPVGVINLILESPKLGDNFLSNLAEKEINFAASTINSQKFFFRNCMVTVTDEGITHTNGIPAITDSYVMEEKIKQHDFSLLPDFFTITRKDSTYRTDFDLQVNSTDCNIFRYLINSSRVYWRKELEEQFGDDRKAAQQYFKDNHFRIDGQGLTEEEIYEQKQNLINKIFVIGYMLHRYKVDSKAWAPFCMDNKIGNLNQCNGRSGKSLLFKIIGQLINVERLNGRSPRMKDDHFLYECVTRDTDIILIDDCEQQLDLGPFFEEITADLTINRKHEKSFKLPYAYSPKFAFTTNYVPSNFDSSTEDRLIYVSFADYYHVKTEDEDNDYNESRSVHNDLGKELFSSFYSEADWNADFNFLMQCCRFYLTTYKEKLKINTPMGNIIKRKMQVDMTEVFDEWATMYFQNQPEHCDTKVKRSEMQDDFIAFSGLKRHTARQFKKKLKALCVLKDWIECLNPKDICNDKEHERIIEKDERNIATEYFYIQTVEGKERQRQEQEYYKEVYRRNRDN